MLTGVKNTSFYKVIGYVLIAAIVNPKTYCLVDSLQNINVWKHYNGEKTIFPMWQLSESFS